MGKKNRFIDVFIEGPYYSGRDLVPGAKKYLEDKKSFRRHNMVKNILGGGLAGATSGSAIGYSLLTKKDKNIKKTLYGGAIGSLVGSGAGYLIGKYENDLVGDYADSLSDN